VAAQSASDRRHGRAIHREPGTQLTMRTFHIGGAAQRGAAQSSAEAAFEATV